MTIITAGSIHPLVLSFYCGRGAKDVVCIPKFAEAASDSLECSFLRQSSFSIQTFHTIYQLRKFLHSWKAYEHFCHLCWSALALHGLQAADFFSWVV